MAGTEKQKREDIVVFWARRDTTCDACLRDLDGGSFIWLEDGKAFCLACADLEHLWFLRRGDTALTRRARKHSGLSAMVLQWSRSRKRYERQGLLVEEAALTRAEEECLADADLREARRARAEEERERWDGHLVEDFAAAIRDGLPACPPDEALRIARRACERHGGRVGRSAAGKALSSDAIDLAVRAHIRHALTPYDGYLMDGWDLGRARSEVRPIVDDVMETWSKTV